MDQWKPLFSWVHISDLHFGHGNAGTYADQRLVLDALRQDAAKTAGQRGIPVPDALLVTGDSLDSAKSLEEFPALEAMLESQFERVDKAGDLDVWVRTELLTR